MFLIKKIIFKSKLLYSVSKSLKEHKGKSSGNKLVNNGLTRLKKDVIGNNNTIEIKPGSKLHDTKIRIRGNNNKIVFEENCYVGSNCSFWMEGNGITIVIGKGTTFTHSVHFCAQEDNTSITIGEDCMFSNNITVRTSDSHPIYNIETGERINNPRNVVLGSHIWIAPNTRIMKGAEIGSGSIIGSDSLVTKKVPENSLAVGHPARVVKEGVRWTREELF